MGVCRGCILLLFAYVPFFFCSFVHSAQIFCEDVEDYELGEALRGDITDNPLDIYMRVILTRCRFFIHVMSGLLSKQDDVCPGELRLLVLLPAALLNREGGGGGG